MLSYFLRGCVNNLYHCALHRTQQMKTARFCEPSNSYEKVKTFKYIGSLLTNQNSIQEEIKCRLKAGNSCYYSVQTLLSSRLLSKNLKIKIKGGSKVFLHLKQ